MKTFKSKLKKNYDCVHSHKACMAFYAILMAIILVSCADLSTDTENPISVNPVMDEATKAPVTGSDFPNQPFTMSASRNGTTFFQGITFSKNGTNWTPSSTKYWPHTGTMAFLAYTCQGLSATATWNSNAASGFSLGSSGNSNTIPDNRTVQADIMYAGTGNVTKSSGTVDLVFKHAQALLKFTGRAYTAYNSGTNTGVTIESITFSSLKYQGKLNVGLTGNTTSASWTLQNTTGSATAASGSWGLPESGTVNVGPGYLVLPQGAVSFTINYTMHKGSSNTVKSYTFTPAGNWEMATSYQYDIFIDQDDVEITSTVTVDQFISKNIKIEPPSTFAGLQIAPAPLYHNGSSFVIKDDDWNHDSYNSTYGAVNGSYFFNWTECHDVCNLSYGGYSDWRVPTISEWEAIINGPRAGASVNGTSGRRYVYIQLQYTYHAGTSSPRGLLLFPDGKILTGALFSNYDTMTYVTVGVTSPQLLAYLNQGCVFLPTSGCYSYGSWGDAGTKGYFWSSDEVNYPDYGISYGRLISFEQNYSTIPKSVDKSRYYYPCRLVRTVN